MDALETGKRIQALRKVHGWTQKELAERLCVTDKAVSKWERGLNYPDMAMLEPLARTLGITMMELLGVENAPEEEKLEAVTAVAVEETDMLKKETRQRAIYGMIMSDLAVICVFCLGRMLIERQVYDLPLNLCIGIICLLGYLSCNHLWIWLKYRK